MFDLAIIQAVNREGIESYHKLALVTRLLSKVNGSNEGKTQEVKKFNRRVALFLRGYRARRIPQTEKAKEREISERL